METTQRREWPAEFLAVITSLVACTIIAVVSPAVLMQYLVPGPTKLAWNEMDYYLAVIIAYLPLIACQDGAGFIRREGDRIRVRVFASAIKSPESDRLYDRSVGEWLLDWFATQLLISVSLVLLGLTFLR